MSGPWVGRWAPGRSAVERWRHLLARGSSPRAGCLAGEHVAPELPDQGPWLGGGGLPHNTGAR